MTAAKKRRLTTKLRLIHLLIRPLLPPVGENDGLGDDCLVETSTNPVPDSILYKANLCGSRESNLNTTIQPNGPCSQRPPAIRSNSSSSSLFATSSSPISSSPPGKEDRKERRISAVCFYEYLFLKSAKHYSVTGQASVVIRR